MRQKKTTLRPILQLFAEEMEKRLARHDHHGRRGWRKETRYYLENQLVIKMGLLKGALSRVLYATGGKDAVLKHATDVANFAMMIADEQDALKRPRDKDRFDKGRKRKGRKP